MISPAAEADAALMNGHMDDPVQGARPLWAAEADAALMNGHATCSILLVWGSGGRGSRRGTDEWTPCGCVRLPVHGTGRGSRRGTDEWTLLIVQEVIAAGQAAEADAALMNGHLQRLPRLDANLLAAEADAALMNGHCRFVHLRQPTSRRGSRRGTDEWTPFLGAGHGERSAPRKPTRH